MKPKASPNNLIFRIRQSLGLTQEQLADKLGCSLMTVRRMEYGEAKNKNQAVIRNVERLKKQAGLITEKK